MEYHSQMTQEEEALLIEQKFQEMLNVYKNSPHRQKIDIITKAFNFAKKAHHGVRRRSGEPYILHPIAVAHIVVSEIGLGSTSICSALLHDVVEDTDYTVEDIENMFGPKIASIVDGLTKISGGVFGAQASVQAENFRKLLLTMSEDIRVILIKIADRLHNMRTLSSMLPAKQLKITGETQYIYAPLAQRLGLFSIKTELEDLCFKYEQPEAFSQIEKKIEEIKPHLKNVFSEFSQPIANRLREIGYDFDLQMRIKSPSSIWRKMQRKHIPFDEVFDLLAARIVFTPKEELSEKEQCWIIYSIITNLYKPHPDRLRDWVTTPKANGYEALHVTVMGNSGNWEEVQIRSRRMNEIAEKGLAAHWKYKTGESEDSELDKWLKTIKELLEHPEPNDIDFMDTFKLNLFASEIFVFTPKGDIRTIPQGATALDFAFYLHSDIGLQCIGAKVNHKLVPLSYVLKSGDQVELLTSKKQHPQKEWIDIVTTAKAKTKLRSIFKKEIKGLIKHGEILIEEELKKIGLTKNSETMPELLSYYKFAHAEDLFYAAGRGVLNLNDIENIIFKKKSQSRWMKIWKLQFGSSTKKEKRPSVSLDKSKTIQLSDNSNNISYRIADCCRPIPGDEVLGIMEDDNSITIHKSHCPVSLKIKSSSGNKLRSVEWRTHKVLSFPAILEIKGIDEVGVLKEIARIISEDYSINISKINIETKDGIFNGLLHIYVYSVEDINNLCMNLLKIAAVKSVNRIDTID